MIKPKLFDYLESENAMVDQTIKQRTHDRLLNGFHEPYIQDLILYYALT